MSASVSAKGRARRLHEHDGGPVPSGPFDSITWQAPEPANVARDAEALQAALAPGGRLELRWPVGGPTKVPGGRHARRRAERHAKRQAKRAAKALRPYFEGGPATHDRPFTPVHALRRPDAIEVHALRRGPGLEAVHFDDLAEHYDDALPAHLVRHYLDQKLARLERAGIRGRGLEVGCGMGHLARAVEQRLDVQVTGTDRSVPAVTQAARAATPQNDPAASAGRSAGRPAAGPAAGPAFLAADALRLPFADGSLDFAYTVNMLHHLKRGEQRMALEEFRRVLRPGAPLLVFEINVRNPLFAFYMRHVFPRTRDIDRGDEEFIDPRLLPAVTGLELERVEHYTFMPDFVPRWMVPLVRPVERLLERAPTAVWSIHYTAVLRRR